MPLDTVCLNLMLPGYLFPFLSSVLLLPPSAGFLRGRWVRAERPEPRRGNWSWKREVLLCPKPPTAGRWLASHASHPGTGGEQ